MKKFYYKKAESLDRTPIILRLERRHTLDAKQDANVERPLSERAASVCSLDQLTSIPTIPRVRSREIAKSYSEDSNLDKGKRTVAKRVITEAELSSSGLYKSMQASINSRFKSPNKSPFRQTDDLAPVKLEDPKMKPIIVNHSRPKNPSACLCRAVTIIALSLCTVGFLAVMAGLIYMEVIANKNLTSHETLVDHTDYKLDFPEGYDQLSSFELNVGEGRKGVQKSVEKATDTLATEDPLKTENAPKEMDALHIDPEKSDTVGLRQYLSNANAKIKFQDGETVIYEVKSSDSMKFDLGGFKGSFLNFNGTENDVLNVKNDSEMIEDEKLASLEAFVDMQHEKLEEQSDEEDSEVGLKDIGVVNDIINDNSVKTKYDESKPDEKSKTSVEIKSSISDATLNADKDLKSLVKPNDLDSVHVHNDESEIGSNSKMNHGFDDKNETELTEHAAEISPFVQDVDEDDSEVVDKDHNIDLMVQVIDDNEEDLDYVIPNRKGDSFPVETSSSKKIDSLQSENKHSAISEKNSPILPKKPVDFKGSLAVAMKHLQVLDVNNKILSSRTKIGKPIENTKKRKQSHISRKGEDVSLERMQYLQKLRNMFYESFQ